MYFRNNKKPTVTAAALVEEMKDEPYFSEYYDEECDEDKKPPNFKTEMCRNTINYGKCNFKGCTYAHSEKELRRKKPHTKKVNGYD